MAAPADELLSPEEEQALHRRLLDRDPTAPSDLVDQFLDHLIARLAERNRVPDEMCFDAAADALTALAKSPTSYQPSRGKGVASYLLMSAQGDLKNRLRQERRHRRRQVSLKAVELSRDGGKYLAVDQDPSLLLEIQEASARAAEQVVAPVRAGLSEAESRALDLLLQGERKAAAFAAALGISDLPEASQRAEVKRVKDKLKKRIEREREGHVEP
jgi:RNA polymerase sigma-70 factor (ECF subfamily)